MVKCEISREVCGMSCWGKLKQELFAHLVSSSQVFVITVDESRVSHHPQQQSD